MFKFNTVKIFIFIIINFASTNAIAGFILVGDYYGCDVYHADPYYFNLGGSKTVTGNLRIDCKNSPLKSQIVEVKIESHLRRSKNFNGPYDNVKWSKSTNRFMPGDAGRSQYIQNRVQVVCNNANPYWYATQARFKIYLKSGRKIATSIWHNSSPRTGTKSFFGCG